MDKLNMGSGTVKYPELKDAITLDIDPELKPDVVWDLNVHPLPFDDNTFDEIHCYDVLEHLASQGDYKFFFNEWGEYWRILKPGGKFHGSTPAPFSRWTWGDPGHTRSITPDWFYYLDKDSYRELGRTQISDYRRLLKCNFKTRMCEFERELRDETVRKMRFMLEAIK